MLHSISEILISEGHDVVQLTTRLPSDADDAIVIEEAQEMDAILVEAHRIRIRRGI